MSGASRSEKSRSTPKASRPPVDSANDNPASLAQPKHESFGLALRAVIKEEFGTSRAFAAALGVSEGRVSQLMSGAESIAASTLEEILATFESVGRQERVHQAWIASFAPSPLQVASAQESEAVASDLLHSFSELIARGKARTMLESLRQVGDAVREPGMRLASFGLRFTMQPVGGSPAPTRSIGRLRRSTTRSASRSRARLLWDSFGPRFTTPQGVTSHP